MVHSPAAVEPRASRRSDHDHVIVLEGATWADFQRVLELRGDRPVPRVAFVEGTLQLMTPSREHESIKSMIGCLVEAWCRARRVEISPYGAWLLEDKQAERGLEPDECYVLGDDPEPLRPDLAIEVVWTHGGVDKLDIYRRFNVREVWIWEDGRIATFALRGAAYEQVGASEVLPGIDLAELCRFILVKPMTRAVREYLATLGVDERGG